jgi:hypothetical protein
MAAISRSCVQPVWHNGSHIILWKGDSDSQLVYTSGTNCVVITIRMFEADIISSRMQKHRFANQSRCGRENNVRLYVRNKIYTSSEHNQPQ